MRPEVLQELQETWAGIRPSPCEVYACEFITKCKAQELACSAYSKYVITNKPYKRPEAERPTRVVFLSMMRPIRGGKREGAGRPRKPQENVSATKAAIY